MAETEPSRLEEASPHIPLAIVDFGRRAQREYTIEELEGFLKYIVETPSNDTIVIAFFVFIGPTFVNILQALQKLDSFQIHLEFGYYHRESGFMAPGRVVQNEPEQIIFAGVSKLAAVSWEEFFTPIPFHFFKEDGDMDLHEVDEDLARAVGKRARRSRYLQAAPHYGAVQQQGGFVNADAKAERVFSHIIEAFSDRGDTIFDFFSGGGVLKTALKSDRECFAVVDSKEEYEFLKLYTIFLRKERVVDQFWKATSRMVQGEPEEEVEPEVEEVSRFEVGESSRAADVDLSQFEDDTTVPSYVPETFDFTVVDAEMKATLATMETEIEIVGDVAKNLTSLVFLLQQLASIETGIVTVGDVQPDATEGEKVHLEEEATEEFVIEEEEEEVHLEEPRHEDHLDASIPPGDINLEKPQEEQPLEQPLEEEPPEEQAEGSTVQVEIDGPP